jgi:hypothetical protein
MTDALPARRVLADAPHTALSLSDIGPVPFVVSIGVGSERTSKDTAPSANGATDDDAPLAQWPAERRLAEQFAQRERTHGWEQSVATAARTALDGRGTPVAYDAVFASIRGGWSACFGRFPVRLLGGALPSSWWVVRLGWPSTPPTWRPGLRNRVHSFRAAEEASALAAFVTGLERGDVDLLRATPWPASVFDVAARSLPALHPFVHVAREERALACWLPGLHRSFAVLVDSTDSAERIVARLTETARAHALEVHIELRPTLPSDTSWTFFGEGS